MTMWFLPGVVQQVRQCGFAVLENNAN